MRYKTISRRWWPVLGLIAVLVGLWPSSGVSQTGAQVDEIHVVFTAHGDHGEYNSPDMLAGLDALAESGAAFSLALGDLSYEGAGDEQRWCQTIQRALGRAYPFEIVMGNHEDEDRANGYIGSFARHCPDRMNSQGIYGAEYYFDYPADTPLMRVIMLGAGNDWDVNGNGRLEPDEYFDYESSSPAGQAHLEWLVDAIDSARMVDIPWIVVGMHKNCLTVGTKNCEIGTELLNLLLDKRVDLVLQGHDHTYQRSKQLALGPGCEAIAEDDFNAACVADTGTTGSYAKGAGTLVVVTGHFGGNALYAVSANDPEQGYFAKAMGRNGWYDFLSSNRIHSDVSRGFVTVDVSASRIEVTHVATTNPDTAFADQFSIIEPGLISQVSAVSPALQQSPTSATAQAPTESSATPKISATPEASPVPDTGVTPVTSATPGASPTPEISPTPDITGLASLTLTPTADAYVDETIPDSGRGRNTVLRVDASPAIRSYLQFDMRGTQAATITRATLRLYANSTSSAGYNVQRVADAPWSEIDLTPATAPALGEMVGASGGFEAGTWTEVDVTAMITGSDVLNLALTATSNTAISFSSRQGENPPQLVLEFAAPASLE